MARKKYLVGGLEFPTIKSLVVYTKHILGRNADLSGGPDFDWLMDLFNRHPNWEKKKGHGIQTFRISKDHHGSYHIVILRTDGTADTISWKTACFGRMPSERQEKIWAYRKEIDPQIAEFRKKSWRIVACQKCNKPFVDAPHVDHSPPFSKIVEDFEKNPSTMSFYDYHQSIAQLALLCRPCNMDKGISL